METKNIFKTLAMALLLPAMLLTTACSNSDDDDVINNNENIVNNNEQTAKKGYPLQVTVNVTREGAAGSRDTRATYTDNGDKTGSLSFSEGDKLYVMGYDTSIGGAGHFAGTLDMVSAGTFSGTITTENPYSGTVDALLTTATALAALLPAGYGTPGYFSIDEKHGYDDELNVFDNKAFATSKAAAVEQFSDEYALEYSGGFTLSPYNAILYFTISGLSASTSVDVALTGPSSLNITGSVTTNGSGEATFAVGVDGGTDFNNLALTVGSNDIPLASGSKELEAGHIYNVNRAVGALAGKFSVSSTKQVYFSKGNLQAVGTTSSSPTSGWTWQFAEHQYDYIGGRSQGGSEPQTGNNYIRDNGTLSANGTVDLFGWSTDATYYGIQDSDVPSDYTGTFQDWGKTIDPSGTTWRTLTMAEWVWVLGPWEDTDTPNPGTNCRTSSTVNGVENARYAKATVAGKAGLIIFPDSYTHPGDVTPPANVNTTGASYTANSYDATKWGKMEAAGAVFLPAAGSRFAGAIKYVHGCEVLGVYWSSVLYNNDETAHNLIFQGYSVVPSGSSDINQGMSVRLVKDAN